MTPDEARRILMQSSGSTDLDGMGRRHEAHALLAYLQLGYGLTEAQRYAAEEGERFKELVRNAQGGG
jgi:hypothetical protein